MKVCVVGTGYVGLTTGVSLAFPVALAGRANSAFNLLVFAGSFAVQWGVGLLIDLFGTFGASPAGAMRGALAVCVAGQAVALLAFVMNRAKPNDH